MNSHHQLKFFYPFAKKNTHFQNEVKLSSIPDKSNHHSIVEIQKNFKEEGSDERNNAVWIQISNNSVKPECKSRLNRIIVLNGELFRLLDINNLPKYRIIKFNNDEQPLSKKIEGGTEFQEYLESINITKKYKAVKTNEHKQEWVYYDDDFKEGMGRGTVGNLFYANDDFHFGNAFLDKNGYFIPIDHDRTISPVSLALHNLSDGSTISTPKLTYLDWINLPIISDYKPNIWHWNEEGALPYALRLSKNKEFIAEKFIATLKLITTYNVQKYLIHFHVEHQDDQLQVEKFLENQRLCLMDICYESIDFKEYLFSQGKQVLCAIIFELNQFLIMNKHYTSLDKEQERKKWELQVNGIIKLYIQLLKKLNLEVHPEDINDIRRFASNIRAGNLNELDYVRDFYKKNQMQTYAKIVEWATQNHLV